MKWLTSILLLTVIFAGALASCGLDSEQAGNSAPPTSRAAGEIIRIYSSLPRQGPSKIQTDSVVNSIKMRFEEDNYQVCGGKFTIDYQDLDDAIAQTQSWDGPTEVGNANKAVSDPDAMIYLGTFNSSAAALSIPILNQAGMVMISPSNTYLGLTKPSGPGEPDKYYPTKIRNYTRVATVDNVQGEANAKWAQLLGIKKVYVLDDQQDYGKGVANEFEKNATALGIKVLGRDSIDGRAQNYTSLMVKIKDLGPELVYFGGIVDNNAGQLLKDMRAVGMTPDKVKFMGPDGIQLDSFIDAAGADVAEGTYATVSGLPFDKLGSKGQEYLKRYQAKYGSQPASYGPFGYEIASVALTALNKVCNKDRAAIRDAVFATRDFDGVLGKWSFDKDGDKIGGGIVGYVVENGKWKQINFFIDGKWEQP